MRKVKLIIEQGGDGKLWGRIEHDDNLLTDFASSVPSLERKMKKLIESFHRISDVEFDCYYDISAFFEKFDFLKQTKIAKLSGINTSLLRQYASGVKYPSPTQTKKIETAIHKLAKELEAVSLYAA